MGNLLFTIFIICIGIAFAIWWIGVGYMLRMWSYLRENFPEKWEGMTSNKEGLLPDIPAVFAYAFKIDTSDDEKIKSLKNSSSFFMKTALFLFLIVVCSFFFIFSQAMHVSK
jgi:hypothetical protein